MPDVEIDVRFQAQTGNPLQPDRIRIEESMKKAETDV